MRPEALAAIGEVFVAFGLGLTAVGLAAEVACRTLWRSKRE